jgi:hypothetical protein
MTMRFGILMLTALLLSACAQELAVKGVSADQGALSREGYAFVSVPHDGQYGSITYQGTGQLTAQTVAGAFAKFLDKSETGLRVENLDEALAHARKLGADYLVVPVILHWEDRATEWSGRRDKIEVKISVLDVGTEHSLASGVVSGKSSWWTFGGDHPEDMLSQPVNEFVSGLF